MGLLRRRLISTAFGGIAALFAGTQYLYSSYSPQLAKRLGLSASHSSLIGFSCVVGATVMGLPAGMIIDKNKPWVPVSLGGLLLSLGYTTFYLLYELQYSSVWLLCFASFSVGWGSILAFFAVTKVTTLNFPNHKGSASAIPIACYGLASMVNSMIKTIFFKNKTAEFLLFEAAASFISVILAAVLVEVVPRDEPVPIQSSDGASTYSVDTHTTQDATAYWDVHESNRKNSFFNLRFNLRRSTSNFSTNTTTRPLLIDNAYNNPYDIDAENSIPSSETTSIQNIPVIEDEPSGLKLFLNKGYLFHVLVLGCMAGVGQLFIFNVGFMVKALVLSDSRYSIDDAPFFQSLQVSLISLFNFLGRLSSGTISDLIHKHLHAQRLWLVQSGVIAAVIAHTLVLHIDSPSSFGIVSAIVGLSFGLCFGVYPTIVGEAFGMKNYSTNWGLLCASPSIVAYGLSYLFGSVYDKNSDHDPTHGEPVCKDGHNCYSSVFVLSRGIAVIIFILVSITLYLNRHSHLRNRK